MTRDVTKVWYVVDATGERHGEYDDEVEAAAHAFQLTVLALGRHEGAPPYDVIPAVRWGRP